MRTLQIEPLSEEAFRPYGRVLGRPSRTADIDKGWLGYWHTLAEIGFHDNPVWGFLEMHQRQPIVEELERHCRSHEVFIPMGGVSIMPIAAGGDWNDPHASPDLDTLRLFLVDGAKALVVGRGIWHTPSFPVGPTAGFLLALEERTPSDDIDVRKIGPFEFSLPV